MSGTSEAAGAPTTLIRGAERVVAWDAAANSHVYLDGADIAFAGGKLIFVGRGYEGRADTVIEGQGLMVMPGLIDIHSHPSTEPMYRGLNEELGSPGLYNSSLYEYMPIFRADPLAKPACTRVAYSEMLLSGVTTVADLSMPHEGWIDLAAESGLRVCLAPMFRSANWRTANGHVVEYDWDEKAGEAAMAEALSLIDEAIAHPSGRLSGMVIPAQIDTSSEGLMRDSFAEAKARDLPWQTHAAQSVVEFHEITRRHGKTPIGWLDELGVLSDRSIIGHAIFLDDHPSTRWSTRSDLDRLAETGTMVAHCPTVFVRRGIAMRDAGRYLRRGVGIGIGTDTYPHNMLSELRLAAYVARLQDGSPRALRSTDIFNAATVAGARALRRDDIGRLAPGCRADLVLVGLDHPAMRPAHDAIRTLIYAADDRAIRAVYVDGRKVVEEGKVLTIDHAGASAALEEAQKRIVARAPGLDWAKRSLDEIVPPTFRTQ
ncbi:Cytosine/adenosine deaminase [Rhizobiales bacterium GAS191]|nr:Cytosine/adenosine deaminase [Rhizobiales bacterium GAS113]SED57453.1 Cytosine/adenosine deaminase [Rhizobiales bacterium GAS191]